MNAKKSISLFLALFLLVSNMGFAFNVHYCGDSIASVSLKTAFPSLKIEKGCCEKVVSKKDSCCKDKVFHFQKKSENATVKVFFFEFPSVFIVPQSYPFVTIGTSSFHKNQPTSYCCDANAPPLFQLYSQYIFYA
ncbi:HYC_CC_PP family protein [Flavobacterium restrictum]|uniref:Uncharacterized protein n=1 Tax=Flavobacterium restrictum TaxID=2594428 RepID=A0A553EBB2_9FLAO|nr:hypothetical protein [Flavobacterium restrictum]TRX42221.1 hypothetical protein FNW21_02870 [Flavobacterium restrictum]